jgi:2-desacetyl-2-hydroxyethyl bacteriochlorophyllide A dehydrogenase
MRVLTCVSPGHFEYGAKQKPVLTKGHALLKIKRIGICGTDLHAYEGTQPYFNYPRILGHELAAELVDYDGEGDFKQGEELTFIPYFYCGECIACRNGKTNCCTSLKVSGVHIDGGMVEFLSVPSYSLVRGNGLDLDSLALIEPLAIGAHGVRRAEIKQDEFVLVVGAGPIGIGTMEFARIAGGRVIALDLVDSRLQFCKDKLNVPFIINGAKQDVGEELKKITDGDMPTVIIDATGSRGAINNSFQYMAHSGKYVLIGLQKEMISFSHPEFHKREGTLMSSRNATRQDFEHVIDSIKQGLINPFNYITHKVSFDEVAGEFTKWLNPSNGVIKAMVRIKE